MSADEFLYDHVLKIYKHMSAILVLHNKLEKRVKELEEKDG